MGWVSSWRCAQLACPAVEPECPAGTEYVSSESECPQDDVHCFEVSDCGGTVWCWEPLYCDGMPVCPEGPEEVEVCGAGEEESSDGECEEVTMCGQTILCEERTYDCDAVPECEEGFVETWNCLLDVDDSCYEETLCRTTIYCAMPL